jgi:hypothetical protein
VPHLNFYTCLLIYCSLPSPKSRFSFPATTTLFFEPARGGARVPSSLIPPIVEEHQGRVDAREGLDRLLLRLYSQVFSQTAPPGAHAEWLWSVALWSAK